MVIRRLWRISDYLCDIHRRARRNCSNSGLGCSNAGARTRITSGSRAGRRISWDVEGGVGGLSFIKYAIPPDLNCERESRGRICESYGGRHHINFGACGGNCREIGFGGGYCRCVCLAENSARSL
jgi:hypothetical protein